ncbi:MAG: hypothetical protein K1X72_19045 [Pyrinomonadaceae bacterium]|nr:hypothetical protein [Pyrinomonadaceae bacterium]
MKRLVITSILGLVLAGIYGFGFIPSFDQSAACADCEAGNLPGIKKAFEAFDAECKKQLAAGEDQKKGCFVSNVYNKVLPVMKGLAKDNRFGPGDRILFIGESQNGNLVAGANRTFVAGAPSAKDNLKVDITKTDGDNGGFIRVCSVDENGAIKSIGTAKFEEKEANGTKTINITSGVQGKIIQIEVASFGGVLKNFKYTLKTSQ